MCVWYSDLSRAARRSTQEHPQKEVSRAAKDALQVRSEKSGLKTRDRLDRVSAVAHRGPADTPDPHLLEPGGHMTAKAANTTTTIYL
jgi:hypothetical protein